MMNIVEEVLRELFRILRHIEYKYSVVDSMKVTDWLRGLHELSINVKGGSTLFPVHAKLTGSELEFITCI
jgi:hypothetical protein